MATIRKRGKSYQIRVSCGYDIAGKQIVKALNWTPPDGMGARQLKKELDRQAVLFEEKCRDRTAPSGSIKLADYIDQWLTDYAEMRLKGTTIAGYRHFRGRVVAGLGHLRLDKITPNHLNAFYRNLMEEGVRNRGLYRCDDFKAITRAAGITAKAVAEKAHVRVETLYGLNHGKNVSAETARKIADALNSTVNYIFEPAQTAADLSSNTVNHYHKFLSTVLSTAVKQGLINDNPCTRADPPAYAEDEPTYLQEDDLQKLIQALAHVEIKYRTAICSAWSGRTFTGTAAPSRSAATRCISPTAVRIPKRQRRASPCEPSSCRRRPSTCSSSIAPGSPVSGSSWAISGRNATVCSRHGVAHR